MSRTVRRAGFTILEAAVALVIVGMVGVATLSAFAAQTRTAEQAQRGREFVALAKHQLAHVELLSAEELNALPDSLAAGRFAAPFEHHEWSASANRVTEEDDLFDVHVRVSAGDESYDLHTRLYRPRRRVTTAP